jgi:hypothetical protein
LSHTDVIAIRKYAPQEESALARSVRIVWLFVMVMLIVMILGGVFFKPSSPMQAQSHGFLPGTIDDVFTPAHSTVFSAAREFLGWRETPVQPIAFPHQVHLQRGLRCVNCHAGADRGPDAKIPGIGVCMTCHQTIATNKPEIQKLKAYRDRDEDVQWLRVYGFEPSAHVKFNHAPHIHAGVDCTACHGNMTTQTVAIRKVDHTMSFCMDCHRHKSASTDCVTCHY